MNPYTNGANVEYSVYETATQPPMQTVPNVMMDGVPAPQQNAGQIQPGGFASGNEGMPNIDIPSNAIPMYAVDGQVTQFEIPDQIMRRSFVQKVFIILLLQNVVGLLALYLFVLFFAKAIPLHVYGGIWLLTLCIFTPMYIFSDVRRYAPMNMVGLLVVTLLWVLQEATFATLIGSYRVLRSQLVIIAEIIAVIVYSKQTRFRFTNINAIILILLIFAAIIGVEALVAPDFMSSLTFGAIFNVIYFVYDTQLMLSGHHGYNLQPQEHIFAAANIYVDMVNLLWRLLKFIFVTPLVRLYRFLTDCCSAEVC